MHVENNTPRRWIGRRAIVSLVAFLAVAAIAVPTVFAAAPQNTVLPTSSGTAREESTLTANNGTWSNTPTSFTYQWERCDSGGANCAAITGATEKTYKMTTADVEKRLRVAVTAVNADGQAAATSPPTAIVSSAKGPVNTVLPAISGTAQVGEELSASTGTWTGGAQSYTYQWQRCDAAGASCGAVADATARTYGVRSIDAGHTMRVVVAAKNGSGTTNATSGASAAVKPIGGNPLTVAKNHAPTIAWVSLKRVGFKIYARFRACDDSAKLVTVIQRDTRGFALAYTRRFAVAALPCSTHARKWVLPARFRHGRYVATLRAVDKSGKSSRTVSRSLLLPSL